MSTLIFIGILTIFILAALFSVIGVILRGWRIRNTQFETICAAWLKRLNTEADALGDKIGGNRFSRTTGTKLKTRRNEAHYWSLACQLDKRFPDEGRTVRLYMTLYVYSLIPAKDGSITTMFTGLTEPVKEWWSQSARYTVFPAVERRLHAKEMELTFAPAPGNVLIPKETPS